MKHIILNIRSLLSMTVAVICLMSCEDQELTSAPEIEKVPRTVNEFNVYDDSQTYYVTLKMSTNSPQGLDEADLLGYKLVINPVSNNSSEALNIDLSEDSDETSDEVSIQILDNNFDSSIESYKLIKIIPEDLTSSGRIGFLCKSRTYRFRSWRSNSLYIENKNGVDRFNASVYYCKSEISQNAFASMSDAAIESVVAPWASKGSYDMRRKGESIYINTCPEGYSYGMAVRLDTKKCASYEITFRELPCD